MSQAKLKCFKTCAAIVFVLVVICQCVGAIKSNYSIGFENVQTRGGGNHGNHGRYNSSHSGHGSGHGGHKNVFNATPVPRSHPTFPTNMHIKPNRTAFGHSNSNHSNHGTHNNSHTGHGSRRGGHSKVSRTTPEPKVSPTSSTKFNPKSNGTSSNSSGNSHTGPGSRGGGHSKVSGTTPEPKVSPTSSTKFNPKSNGTSSNSSGNSHTGPGSRGGGHSKVSGTTPEPKVSPTSSTKFNPKSNGTSSNSSGNSHTGPGSRGGGHSKVSGTTPEPKVSPTFSTKFNPKSNGTSSNSSGNSHTGPGSRGGGHSKVSGTTPEPKVSPTSSTKFNPKSNGTSNNSSGNNHTGPGSRGGGHSNVSSTTPEPGNNATVTHLPSGPTSANKTRPSTNSRPLVPQEPQEPMLLPGNGTEKIIYFDQTPHKNSTDWKAFDLIVTYLRNISSNANKHKKRTQIINGEKIQHYYVTRDYYHNSHNVPKTMEENEDRLKLCAWDATKIWCVPNSYSMCSDDRIMCVAYLSQTVPCGNHTCVVTKYPCDTSGKNPFCAHDDDVFTYIPCVSYMRLYSTPTADIFTHTHKDFCILSIIEAVPLESPVAAITNLFFELGKSHINAIRNQNITYK